jgi:hypothetical protein
MKTAAAFPVDALELMLTLRCNLACTYCLRHEPDEEMSADLAARALDLLFSKPAARKDLTFTGGEPLLRLKRVKALAASARRRARRSGTRLRLNVLTNGAALTAEALDFLDADDVRVVVTAGGGPESHDLFRVGLDGRASWPRVEKGLSALVRRVPPSRLLVTVAVHPERAHALRDDVRFLVGKGARNFNLCSVFGAPWTARQASDLARQYAAVLADAVAGARSGDPFVIQALGSGLKRWTGTTPHYDYSDTGGTHCPLTFRLIAWPDGTLSLNPFRFGPRAADHAVGHLRGGFKEEFRACAPDGSACPACRKRVVGVDRGYGAAYMAGAGVDPEGFRRSWQANVLLCDGAVNRAAAEKIWSLSSGEPALKRYVEVSDSWSDLVG